MLSGCPSGRSCVHPSGRCPLTSIPRDAISSLRRGISIKLSTSNHHVSEHCCKGFNGQGSKVKVIARSRNFYAWWHISLPSEGIQWNLAQILIMWLRIAAKELKVMGSKDMGSYRSWSFSNGHRNVVTSIAPEPLNEFEPKLTQILTTLGRQTV